MLRRLSKPIGTVVRWQVATTGAMALVAAALGGAHAAFSAAAGGMISVIAGSAGALVASRSGASSPGRVLASALKGEAVKIGLALILLWLVATNYRDAEIAVLLGSFVVTMLIFGMAFFVREY